MKIFLDTEFWEDGPGRPLQLISLGMHAQDGTELYVVNTDFDWGKCNNAWLHKNVRPGVGKGTPTFLAHANIDLVVLDWIKRLCPERKPEFWGYYSDYDWVLFCQIFGAMVDLPNIFPKYCMDIKQLAVMLGNPTLPEQAEGEHNALYDARWNRKAWEFLMGASKVA